MAVGPSPTKLMGTRLPSWQSSHCKDQQPSLRKHCPSFDRQRRKRLALRPADRTEALLNDIVTWSRPAVDRCGRAFR
jgi:hypothetical protein